MNRFRFPISFVILVTLGFLVNSCEDSTTQPVEPQTPIVDLAASRQAVNKQVSEQIIIPGYEGMVQKSDELVVAINSFANGPDEAKLASAQAALKSAWLEWQEVNLFLFGPSETATLRSALATYPTNTDKIEANIVSGSYVLGSLDNRAAIGFPALDYLLNGLGENAAAIVEAYRDGEGAPNRKQYIQDLAREINDKLKATLNGWLPAGGNYLEDFNAASASGTDVGSSLGLLVNAIDLHFQRYCRDGKIAIPAGVRSAGVPRPKTVEVLHGGYSVELLVANLKAYQKLFEGIGANEQNGAGIYDYLVALEQEDLAEDLDAQFDEAITAASELSDPLQAQIDADLEKVTNVFLELQDLVVLIKSDMASVMGISITNQDNDGD